MPDQMPDDGSRHFLHLRERFLHAVLSTVVDPGLPRRGRGVGAVGLRDGNDGNVLPMPPARDSVGDSAANGGDPIGEFRKNHSHEI